MSELKKRFIDDTYVEYFNTGNHELAQIYLKSEADKVIAELEENHNKEVGQLLINIAEQKSEIERLENLCAVYRHDCDNLAISNEQVKIAASTLIKNMNHYQRKRCLSMAKSCEYRFMNLEKMIDTEYRTKKMRFSHRWWVKWLKLADKFKEAK